MIRNRVEADAMQFARLAEDASVEVVDTPPGRKHAEIAASTEDGFTHKEGEAVGVYHEPNRRSTEVVHIDWVEGERTSVAWDNVVTFEEGGYYTQQG